MPMKKEPTKRKKPTNLSKSQANLITRLTIEKYTDQNPVVIVEERSSGLTIRMSFHLCKAMVAISGTS